MGAFSTQLELLLRKQDHDRELLEQKIESLEKSHADELEKMELRLRIQISEELHRLPPSKDSDDD